MTMPENKAATTTPMTDLPQLFKLSNQVGKMRDFTGLLLAVDPGETTGVTLLHKDVEGIGLVAQHQLETWPIEKAVKAFAQMFEYRPTFVVYESYHVYKWRLQEHSFSEVPTIQIIGCLKTFCVQHKVPYAEQTAQTGKAFFKDELLKRIDMYIEGMPHARDSLRHACQYVTFGLKKS